MCSKMDVKLYCIVLSLNFIFAIGINWKSQLIRDLIGSYRTHIVYKVVYYGCTKKEAAAIMLTLPKTGHYVDSSSIFTKPLPYSVPNNHLVYVIDLSCDYIHNIISEADERKLFNEPHHWILLNFNDINVTEVLDDVDALVDSDVILVNDATNGTYVLSRLYKLKQKLQINYEVFGLWTQQELYLQPNFTNHAAVRRKNLQMTCLNTCIVITHNSSLKHLTDKREKHIDSIAKVNYVFTQHIGDLLNATMNYSIEPTWGYKVNNSHWTGMIGELTTHRADIGGTALFLTSDRVSIIDYIAMTTPTRSKFVFRQPKLSYITNVFTLPFETSVWISSVALVLITAFGLYLVIKWEWYKKRVYQINEDDKHLTDTELQDSFVDVIFLAVGAVCQQGASAVPYNTAGRVITLLLFISLMFLYTSYSANIVALLQSSSTSIQTLADLLHSRMQVGVDDTVFNHFYFPNASEPIRRALYLQKVVPSGQAPRYFAIEEGVRRMRGGLFAFHMETGAGYKIVGETFLEDEKCDLEEIQFLQVPDPWFAIQKNSSYKEMLKIGLRKIQESGIQAREVSLLYTKKPVCSSRGSSFIGVGIVDCYPAALVLAVGAVISFTIFIVEILFYRLLTRH